ncbi:MAG: hypothetical protein IIC11_11370 [Proteobacteria bacterium]|nr:hypothetical protein [Pseudomonadota bacterium]
MRRLKQLKRNLKPGNVYRRSDLEKWSKSVDRHARQLVEEGVLKKLQNGLYYYPKESTFGEVPPTDRQLVSTFLKDDNFLLTSPNMYNALGLGTTQLYNTTTVYNQKRHGQFKLGNRTYDFQRKYNFPKKLSSEFLLVDLMNNLKALVEDHEQIKTRVKSRALNMDSKKLLSNAEKYGKVSTKKFFSSLFGNGTTLTNVA